VFGRSNAGMNKYGPPLLAMHFERLLSERPQAYEPRGKKGYPGVTTFWIFLQQTIGQRTYSTYRYY
jgi:hypothetical protein